MLKEVADETACLIVCWALYQDLATEQLTPMTGSKETGQLSTMTCIPAQLDADLDGGIPGLEFDVTHLSQIFAE